MDRLDSQLIINPALAQPEEKKENKIPFPFYSGDFSAPCFNKLKINAKIFLSFYFPGHLNSLNQD